MFEMFDLGSSASISSPVLDRPQPAAVRGHRSVFSHRTAPHRTAARRVFDRLIHQPGTVLFPLSRGNFVTGTAKLVVIEVMMVVEVELVDCLSHEKILFLSFSELITLVSFFCVSSAQELIQMCRIPQKFDSMTQRHTPEKIHVSL